ncbi:MAG: hypothetical protein FWH47_05320 [Methanomassiliicoccaceae archaeon]|nr:hypothetical protein [Methanomassiliicoccaceae archaeon]
MWEPSLDLRKALVHAHDVIDDPEGYPPEFVKALMEIAETGSDALWDESQRYRFEGYILMHYGVVGIRPDSKPDVRKEWMRYWKLQRDRPMTYM